MSARERLDSAALDGVATDVRHNLAYDAARSAAQGVMMAEGYRSAMAAGHHQALFEFLTVVAEGRWEREADYFDKARRRRNRSEYGRFGLISAKGADDMLATADEFVAEVREWLGERGLLEPQSSESDDAPQDATDSL